MLLLVILTIAGLRSLSSPGPVSFKSLEEFREFAQQWRLCCMLGAAETMCGRDNLFVAPQAVSSASLPPHKGQCGLTEAWQGVIWIADITGPMALQPTSLGGHWRLWGNLVAAGDPALMDRIEELFRRQKRG
jgi:hypothetical protein